MLSFLGFVLNLFDLNGCGEINQAECPPPNLKEVGQGGILSFPSPSLSLPPSPHRSSKALASSNKHF